MPNVHDRFSVEMVDPPVGWDDRQVEVRHRDINENQIGDAVTALLNLAYRCWISNGSKGHAPSVTVRKTTESVGQISLPLDSEPSVWSQFSKDKENFIAP